MTSPATKALAEIRVLVDEVLAEDLDEELRLFAADIDAELREAGVL